MKEQLSNVSFSGPVLSPWQAIRKGLGIGTENATEFEAIPVNDEHGLKTEIMRLWKTHEQSKQALGKPLYELQKLLHNPGKKNSGFDFWLKQNGIPRSTAYWLIKKYCKREGLAASASSKTGTKKSVPATPALSNIGQTGAGEHAEYIPAPTSVSELIGLLARFFDQVTDPAVRSQHAMELREWLDSNVAGTEIKEAEEA
jgi:hypothetical protein